MNSRNRRLLTITLLIVITLSLVSSSLTTISAQRKYPLYVSFVWHYHQPWYYNENESVFILPWVRMHSIGNYYKMAYILSKYPDIKVTFTFSGSLLEQLIDYTEKGLMDYRQILSWKIAKGEKLSNKEIYDMLKMPGGFFDINWNRFVNKIPRYKVLRDKAQEILRVCSEAAKSDEELYACVANRFVGPHNEYYQRVIDLAVMFNLYWIDPLVAKEEYPGIYNLMKRGYETPAPKYTVNDLKLVLETQLDIMKKIIPLYKQLAHENRIELIPVPYSHPLAPIITDFGWIDDIELHVEKSIMLFKQVFNYTPRGIWPAEQAVNEYVLEAFTNANITWTITDQTLLSKAGISTSSPPYLNAWYIQYNNGRIYVVFRNTELSNLISFEYSKQLASSAVEDLCNRIVDIANSINDDKPHLLVIALDGENPWENYEEFGDLFLETLYQKLGELQKENIIKTITPGEFINMYNNYASSLPLKTYEYLSLKNIDVSDMPRDNYGDAYTKLPRKSVKAHIPEGSWGGGELSIWIGDRQENTAWMWLKKAREDVLRALNSSTILDAYMKSPKSIEYLLKAEASDWFWWYGWDGGGSPETFDPLFKAYLRRAYEYAGLKPPSYLYASFYPDGESRGWLNSYIPKPLDASIKVDGELDNVWSRQISDEKGLNITVGASYVKSTYIGVNGYGLYAVLIPWNKEVLNNNNIEIAIYLSSPRRSLSPYHLGYNVFLRNSTIDPGHAIAFEILINPAKRTGYVNAANGKGGYVTLYSVDVGVDSVVEVYVPWSYLGLLTGDLVYISIVVYKNYEPIEYSTRLGYAYRLKVPPPPTGGVTGKIVFDMKDPEGDDDGPGGYQYPLNKVFQPGVFDMLEFRVINEDDKVRFEIKVKNLGDNPWGGPNGFCLQYIHIYIHTTSDLPGRTDTYGLNVNISKDSSWQIAILIAPGWGTSPVPAGEKAAIYYYNDTVVVQDDYFKVFADETTNTIVAVIDKKLLIDVENIDKWKYVVALTSYDGYGPQRIRSITPKPSEWTLGAPGYEQAIISGVIPRIMDLLAPTKELQYNMLKSFDPENKKFAVLESIGKEAVPTTPTNITQTITTTIYKTSTVTTTVEKTSTITITSTQQITTTHTSVSITTITTTTQQTSPLYLLIGLFLGAIVGYLFTWIARRKS